MRRYTGQENQEERRRTAENPPDILLTNFMMAELLLTRQDELDAKIIDNANGLEFIVLDELQTYRGRQGADVAILVRRLRNRCSPDRGPICIGTSATMASEAQLDKAGTFASPFVTRIEPGKAFYPAEACHQDYATLHPDQPYIAFNDLPKIGNLSRLFPDLYRPKARLVADNASSN